MNAPRGTLTVNLGSISPYTTPAVARVVVSLKVDGSYEIDSTTGKEETIDMLDKALECIDGQRLPPE